MNQKCSNYYFLIKLVYKIKKQSIYCLFMEQLKLNSAFNSWEADSYQFNFKSLTCVNQNKAVMVCISQGCSHPGLLCANTDNNPCLCLQKHVKCDSQLLIKNIERKYALIKQINLKAKQSLKPSVKKYEMMLDSMIERLSQMKDQLYELQDKNCLTEGEKQFLKILNQGKFQFINSKVVKNMLKRDQYQILKTQKEISLLAVQNKKKFDQLCIIIRDSCFRKCQPVKLVTSQQEERIKQWLNQSTKKIPLNFNLIYRASQNQFSAVKFHEKCDQKNNLLVVLKNQFNKTIGGFTPLNWKTENVQYKKDYTYSSFIFSLNMNQKFECLDYERTIFCGKNRVLCFGGQFKDKKYCNFDIVISEKANKQESYGRICTNYNSKKIRYRNNQETRSLFTGNPEGDQFKIDQWEVYQVQFQKY